MKKQLLTIIIAVVMLFTCTACSEGGGWLDLGGNNSGTINVLVYEAGYGTEWLKSLASEYKKRTGVKVNVSVSYVSGEIESQLRSNTLKQDIVMPLSSSIYEHQAKFADLSDVYNAIPKGEDKTIKEKMNQNIYAWHQSNGETIRFMNWIESVCTLFYNKTTLDKLFGEDNYQLPRTTDELGEFADKIKTASGDSVYPFTYSTAASYLDYPIATWWAQYEGLDNWNDYFKGYYTDETGERSLDKTGDVLLNMPGRRKALEVAKTILSKSSGNVHAHAEKMSHTEAQISFLGQGYGGNTDMKEVAMMFNGDWLENEMAVYLGYKWADIRLARMPVISSIVEKLEDTSMTDKELRELITAIDNGATSYAGVSANDFNRVKQARMMAFTNTFDHSVAVLESSTKKDMAKEFLIFMASDEGQKIYSEQLGGLTQSYGYTPEASTISAFAQSRHTLFGNDFVPISLGSASPLYYSKNFNWIDNSVKGQLGVYILNGNIEDVIQTTKTAFQGRWADIISVAK